MRREEEFKGDVLRGYFGNSEIEKAPEGFTSKVMSHIYMQSKPVKPEKKTLIPHAYVLVTVALVVIAAFILPAENMKFPDNFQVNFHFTFPDLPGNSKLPAIILYIIAAVILLVVLDSGLKSLFRRVKN